MTPTRTQSSPWDAADYLATDEGSSSRSEPDNDRKQASERDDQTSGIAPSAAKLKRIIGPSPGYRMLTPYEIELLRKSKREMDP